LNIPARPDQVIPKFCTNINLNFLSNKNLILTMYYVEPNASAIIEKIIIDVEHAKSLHGVLTKLLEDAKNV
jgi:hypothetical protein